MKPQWDLSARIFDEYERRFAEARAEKRMSHPWESAEKERIIESAKRMLRYDDSLIPPIREMTEIVRTEYNGYSAIQYRFESRKNMFGSATLYLPYSKERLPLVFVCCGHGKSGRLTESYMAMGHRLASLGLAALVIDNIGQGDRNRDRDGGNTPDHWMATAPFKCGLTLQGLIVAETIGLIRYMKKDERFDPERFAACGNSGGGTLTMFLSALCPEISVIASSGYPSEISYILQKEREHCACNLFVGAAHEAEMWELYSTFAPKPMLLEGGIDDNLIPMDLAHRNARKVQNTYVQMGAENNFTFELTDTKHSWELDDINLISRFLSEKLTGITPADAAELFAADDITPFKVPIPEHSLSTMELCEYLSGIPCPEDVKLEEIFVPTFEGKPFDRTEIQDDVGRGDIMRVFAQFECALYKSKENAKEED